MRRLATHVLPATLAATLALLGLDAPTYSAPTRPGTRVPPAPSRRLARARRDPPAVEAIGARDLVGPLGNLARRWPASPLKQLEPRRAHATQLARGDVRRSPVASSTRARRARFAAKSDIVDHTAFGGFAQSRNRSRPLRAAPRLIRRLAAHAKALQLLADARGKTLRLLLINSTGHTIRVDALDSTLPIVQQARDPHGVWRDVQTLPSSFCGNSRHRLYLENKRYWTFAALRYKGARQTLLRFQLRAGRLRLNSNVYRGRW